MTGDLPALLSIKEEGVLQFLSPLKIQCLGCEVYYIIFMNQYLTRLTSGKIF
jgi:hypothetical protein